MQAESGRMLQSIPHGGGSRVPCERSSAAAQLRCVGCQREGDCHVWEVAFAGPPTQVAIRSADAAMQQPAGRWCCPALAVAASKQAFRVLRKGPLGIAGDFVAEMRTSFESLGEHLEGADRQGGRCGRRAGAAAGGRELRPAGGRHGARRRAGATGVHWGTPCRRAWTLEPAAGLFFSPLPSPFRPLPR